LNDLRNKFKTTIAAIDELEAAWSKVKLANKLGCSASELTYKSVDVSAEKIGRVIGKNGATIKQLESEHRVVLNVDSVAGKIQLTGSDMAVGIAILEIEKICSAIDVDVSVATDLLTFLTTKVRR
jgi:rRNA processing protein Krr1/Pno1